MDNEFLEELGLKGAALDGAKAVLAAQQQIREDIGFDESGDGAPITEAQHEVMTNVISEHLGAYVIVGYDLAGNRYSNWQLPTPQAVDAVFVQLRESLEISDSLIERYNLTDDDND